MPASHSQPVVQQARVLQLERIRHLHNVSPTPDPAQPRHTMARRENVHRWKCLGAWPACTIAIRISRPRFRPCANGVTNILVHTARRTARRPIPKSAIPPRPAPQAPAPPEILSGARHQAAPKMLACTQGSITHPSLADHAVATPCVLNAGGGQQCQPRQRFQHTSKHTPHVHLVKSDGGSE